MKRKKNTCHALEFAKQLDMGKPWIEDLKSCDEEFMRSYPRLKAKGFVRDENDVRSLSRTVFTVHRWLASKQCYSITEALAEDLFAMEDLSFPLDDMHLPFPCFYLDMEPFGEDLSSDPGSKLLGYYVMVEDVPYGDTVGSCCSVVTLALQENGEYTYGGAAFDFAPEHMEMSLNDTVSQLAQHIEDQKKHITRALLFAAYLSSAQPEVVENEAQKQFYRPSAKPKYSSMRKWDVGVRYMQEKQKYAQELTGDEASKAGPDGGTAQTGVPDGKAKRNPPKPHMRKAHWQTYRTGHGRTGKKIVWIPPLAVGMPKGRKQEHIPVVVREQKERRD